MGCGACGPTRDPGTERMYKELEKKVRADEEAKKQAERDRRVSTGLPAEEGEVSFSLSFPPRLRFEQAHKLLLVSCQ
jgi:hypothetical protein